ncbi:hypothetical protein EJB05_28815, partial [Eragrostis curvula]
MDPNTSFQTQTNLINCGMEALEELTLKDTAEDLIEKLRQKPEGDECNEELTKISHIKKVVVVLTEKNIWERICGTKAWCYCSQSRSVYYDIGALRRNTTGNDGRVLCWTAGKPTATSTMGRGSLQLAEINVR